MESTAVSSEPSRAAIPHEFPSSLPITGINARLHEVTAQTADETAVDAHETAGNVISSNAAAVVTERFPQPLNATVSSTLNDKASDQTDNKQALGEFLPDFRFDQHFKLEGRVGEGGRGVVMPAVELATGQHFAAKFVRVMSCLCRC